PGPEPAASQISAAGACGGSERLKDLAERAQSGFDVSASPREEAKMARVALVTGGTRGIGEAISTALKEAGRTVVASYAGNDAAANAFHKQTGIPVIKFDAGDFAACETAVKQIHDEH